MQQILRSYWGAPWVVDVNLQIGKCGAKDEIESSADKQLLMQWKEYTAVCLVSRKPPGNVATQLSTDNVQLCEG